MPGTVSGTNFSSGVRDADAGGASGTTGGSYYINMGQNSMANAPSGKNILLQFGLKSGHSISSVTVEGY